MHSTRPGALTLAPLRAHYGGSRRAEGQYAYARSWVPTIAFMFDVLGRARCAPRPVPCRTDPASSTSAPFGGATGRMALLHEYEIGA